MPADEVADAVVTSVDVQHHWLETTLVYDLRDNVKYETENGIRARTAVKHPYRRGIVTEEHHTRGRGECARNGRCW